MSGVGKKSTKGLRRNIRRISERKGIDYRAAILLFFNVDSISKIDKNLLYSIYKNTRSNPRDREISRFI